MKREYVWCVWDIKGNELHQICIDELQYYFIRKECQKECEKLEWMQYKYKPVKVKIMVIDKQKEG